MEETILVFEQKHSCYIRPACYRIQSGEDEVGRIAIVETICDV